MLPDSKQQIARRFFAEQDRLRGGPAEELCAPNYTAHLASNPAFDLAGHQAFASAFYAGFPDLRHTVNLTIAEGNCAAVRFTLNGTHTGQFLHISPTGRSISITASVMMRFEGGQVAELWGEFDQIGLISQLTHAETSKTSVSQGL